jgi:hypothetical protein
LEAKLADHKQQLDSKLDRILDIISNVSGLQASNRPGRIKGDTLPSPQAAGGGGDFYNGRVGVAGRNASCLEPAQSTLLGAVDSSAPAVFAFQQQNGELSKEGRGQSTEQKGRDDGSSLTAALCFPKDWFHGDFVRK